MYNQVYMNEQMRMLCLIILISSSSVLSLLNLDYIVLNLQWSGVSKLLNINTLLMLKLYEVIMSQW